MAILLAPLRRRSLSQVENSTARETDRRVKYLQRDLHFPNFLSFFLLYKISRARTTRCT